MSFDWFPQEVTEVKDTCRSLIFPRPPRLSKMQWSIRNDKKYISVWRTLKKGKQCLAEINPENLKEKRIGKYPNDYFDYEEGDIKIFDADNKYEYYFLGERFNVNNATLFDAFYDMNGEYGAAVVTDGIAGGVSHYSLYPSERQKCCYSYARLVWLLQLCIFQKSYFLIVLGRRYTHPVQREYDKLTSMLE